MNSDELISGLKLVAEQSGKQSLHLVLDTSPMYFSNSIFSHGSQNLRSLSKTSNARLRNEILLIKILKYNYLDNTMEYN